jgi:hypothetical protein
MSHAGKVIRLCCRMTNTFIKNDPAKALKYFEDKMTFTTGQVTGTPTASAPYSARASPVILGGRVLSGVTAIAAGGYDQTLALKNDGSVVGWGFGCCGQTRVPVAAQSGVTAIAQGYDHIVALKNDGSIVAWWKQLLRPNDGARGLEGVTAIAASYDHTVALLGTAVSLQARRSENDWVLSWPASASGFTLQSTLSLTPPVSWIDWTNPPAVVGTQFTVTNIISGGAQFYRLRKP